MEQPASDSSSASTVAFDVNAVEVVLQFWSHSSALGSSSFDPHGSGPQDLAAAISQLQLIPWRRTDDSRPLEAWEVIPVTKEQARRLMSIPAAMWESCLEEQSYRRIQSHLLTFEEWLINEPDDLDAAAAVESKTPAADPDPSSLSE